MNEHPNKKIYIAKNNEPIWGKKTVQILVYSDGCCRQNFPKNVLETQNNARRDEENTKGVGNGMIKKTYFKFDAKDWTIVFKLLEVEVGAIFASVCQWQGGGVCGGLKFEQGENIIII